MINKVLDQDSSEATHLITNTLWCVIYKCKRKSEAQNYVTATKVYATVNEKYGLLYQ